MSRLMKDNAPNYAHLPSYVSQKKVKLICYNELRLLDAPKAMFWFERYQWT